MQLGMIGLGRMGANIARRAAKDGHDCVVYDHDREAVKAMEGEERTTGAFTLAELRDKLDAPRVVWVMVPAGNITSSVIEIAHAPRAAANSADDEIVRLVQADVAPHEIRVVTSDKALSDRIRGLGAEVFPAVSFRDLVDPRGK